MKIETESPAFLATIGQMYKAEKMLQRLACNNKMDTKDTVALEMIRMEIGLGLRAFEGYFQPVRADSDGGSGK